MPFAFRWRISVILTASGLMYAIVLSISRRLFERHEKRRVHTVGKAEADSVSA